MNRFLTMVCSFSVLSFSQAFSQVTYEGCRDVNGIPVASVVNYNINDVAMATIANGQPVVFYNPNVLMRMSPQTRRFFYAHECAHHALGHLLAPSFPLAMEQAADCWGIKTLYEGGMLTQGDLATIAADMARFGAGDWSHLPGPQRAINLYACLGLPDPRKPSTAPEDVEDPESAGYEGPIDAFAISEAECLENGEEGPDLKWNPSASSPNVSYLLSVKNSCEEGNVNIIVIVSSGQVPHDADKDDYSDFEVFKTRRHSFSLAAGASNVVRGTLTWTRMQETMPKLRTLLYYKRSE